MLQYNKRCPVPVMQADLSSAQHQLSDLQAQCEALTSERNMLQQQNADTAAGTTKLREQLQQALADAARLQKDADSSAREASSLRMQLSQQVSAMQELQQAASGSGKELQVRHGQTRKSSQLQLAALAGPHILQGLWESLGPPIASID